MRRNKIASVAGCALRYVADCVHAVVEHERIVDQLRKISRETLGKAMRRSKLPRRFTWNIFSRPFWWENKVRRDLRRLIDAGLVEIHIFYCDLTAKGRRAYPLSMGEWYGAAKLMASGSGDPRQYRVRVTLFMRYGPPAPVNCRCTLKPSGSRPINEGAVAYATKPPGQRPMD